MKAERKSRSGKLFFLVAVVLVFAGILVTVMLANRHRNLDLLLTHLGYPDLLEAWHDAPKPVEVMPIKGRRLPAPRMALPLYAFADFKASEQYFVRLIQSDPKTLCDQVRAGGFGDLQWTVSLARTDRWECSSFLELPPDAVSAKTSSLFVTINGDGENRVSSFRIKLNIDNAADTQRVADLASNAATIFLRQVRWGNPGDIIDRIRRLEAFDIRNFGSRIQLKKEFGDTPRYNFLASQTSKPGAQTPGDSFFDRQKWFPLTGHDGLPMVDGMMAGEHSQGLSLPVQAR